ncbi:MAG: hypothetical protein F4X65_15660 [Chloroflexi bacterium]|nr:hypothetical protein [Chloroflexota bacterium]
MTTREELVRRAASLVPVLRERAAETEKRRQALPETIEDLKAAELIVASQPERFGGLGLDFDVVFEIAAELGRGCGSSAWCYGIWASHNWLMALFPESAQEEYWADDPNTLSSTSFNPARGKVTATSGGYKLSGQWDFSSGCDPAHWVLLIANGPETPMMMLLPRRDYRIKDTWFVSGLKGTGSKDILVDDVFVPEYRTVPMPQLREGNAPGRTVHGTANQRIPQQCILPFTLASPIVGMARGVIDCFEERIRTGTSARDGNPLSEVTSYQLRLAESSAEVWAAMSIMQRDCREIMERAHRDRLPSIDDRARYRRDHAYVARLSLRAIDRLFEASGGHGLYDSNPMQRFHRDAHAASHHVGLSWDLLAEQYGRVRAGLEPDRRLV